MSNQNRPLSKKDAPDPARSYERAKPEKESGMGRLEEEESIPSDHPDRTNDAVRNRQRTDRQINSQDDKHVQRAADPRHVRTADRDRMSPPAEVEGSMKDEEPLGEDQSPQEHTAPEFKRHPRKEGKGGTP